MVARLFEIIQFLDNSGNPLAGGKVHTFQAGTSTPKAAFTDATAATAHPNPIILDSSGRAQIWLSGTAYKLDIDDSTDVDIIELDNVPATSIAGASISVRATATTSLACTSGAVVLTASALVPANARLLGVYTENTVAPGTSQGLTGYDVGSHGSETRWGSNIGLTLNGKNTIGNFALSEFPISAVAQDITITARGGTFDGVGTIDIDVEFETGTAP